MSIVAVVLIVCVLLVAFLVVLSVKQSARKRFLEALKASFVELKKDSKTINESFLEESNQYLDYAATDVKDINKIKTDLVDILDKYKESGKLSNDDFYDKAYKAIAR